MKKFLRSASVASALTILSLVAIAGPLPAYAASKHHTTLHIFEHYVNYKEVNIFKGKDKRGNYLVFDDPVFDGADKRKIGHASGSCFYTTNKLQECSWSIILPKGSISLEGPEPLNPHFTNAVTGGTGAYRLARGEAKIYHFKRSGIEEYEYHIQLA